MISPSAAAHRDAIAAPPSGKPLPVGRASHDLGSPGPRPAPATAATTCWGSARRCPARTPSAGPRCCRPSRSIHSSTSWSIPPGTRPRWPPGGGTCWSPAARPPGGRACCASTTPLREQVEHALLALHGAGHPHQPLAVDRVAVARVHSRPHDHVHQAVLVLQRQEHEAFGRGRALAADDHAGHPRVGAVAQRGHRRVGALAAHGAAQRGGLGGRKPGDLDRHAQALLLVEDDAQRLLQHRLELGVRVRHRLLAAPPGVEPPRTHRGRRGKRCD